MRYPPAPLLGHGEHMPLDGEGDRAQRNLAHVGDALGGKGRLRGQGVAHFVALQNKAALDAGRTTSPGQDSAYRLSGVALGLRGSHKVNEAYPLQWDVFVSKPLARPDGFTTAKHTAGFTLRAEF